MVDMLDLGSSERTRGGSSPSNCIPYIICSFYKTVQKPVFSMKLPTLPAFTVQQALLLFIFFIAAISKKVLLLNEELLLSVCVFAFALFAVQYGGDSVRETLEARQQNIRQAFQQGILHQQANLQDLRTQLVQRTQAPARLQALHGSFLQNFETVQQTQLNAEQNAQRTKIGNALIDITRPQTDGKQAIAYASLSGIGSLFKKQPDLQKEAMQNALENLRAVCARQKK